MRALGREEAELPDYLDAKQEQDPAPDSRADLQLLKRRVVEAEYRVVGHLVPDDEEPQHDQQNDELEPVPERQAAPSRLPGRITHQEPRTVNESTTVLICA